MGIKRTMRKSAEADLILLYEAFNEFEEEKRANNLAEATIKNYQESFLAFLNLCDYDETVTTDEITAGSIIHWINAMKLNDIKVASINHYLRDMRAFLYWCMADGREYIKPAFKVTMLKAQEEQIKLFSDEELELLLEKPSINASFTEWRSWAVTNWVLGTGNRESSICKVTIGDVDFTKKEIALTHTKNKKAQVLPLAASLETVLKEYIRVWLKGASKSSYLFPNVGGEYLTPHALTQAFSKYCKNRGAEHTSIHGLRHNFAKGWVKNNGNMFALQQILGHATLEMTRKYVRMFSEDIKEDFDKFNVLDTMKKAKRRTLVFERNK